MSGVIPNAVPFLGGNEWKYLKECLDSNWVSSAGPFIERFEREVATYVGAQHAVATVNGTAALGAEYKGRGVGVHERVACLSFTGNKIITCGGGGMVLTDDPALARRAALLSTQGRTPGTEFLHEEVGYNYRLTNIQAALGLAQLEQLDRFVEDKRETARDYADALRGLAGAEPFREEPWARSSYWMSSVLLDPEAWGNVRTLIQKAKAASIELRPLWYPLHQQPVFTGCEAFRVEHADALHARGVSLPCSVGITSEERARVVAFLAGQRR